MTEQRIQQDCYMWFHNTYPHLRGLFFRIKNEGTNKISGAIGKGTGIVPGVSDMILLEGERTVLVEFKTPNGKQSPLQKYWQTVVEKRGYSYHLIHSLEEFKELCQTLHL